MRMETVSMWANPGRNLEIVMTEDQLKLFEGIKALGVEVHDRPWGALLYRPDPNGISGAPHQMIEITPDGVNVWAEAHMDDSPETLRNDEYDHDDTCATLEEFVKVTYQSLLDDELDDEPDWTRAGLITFMIGQGWERFTSSDGIVHVRHANDHTKIFDSWFDAAKACIEVASEF